MTTTHRCPDCPQHVEHDDGYEWDDSVAPVYRRVRKSEICLSCGRCSEHCHDEAFNA